MDVTNSTTGSTTSTGSGRTSKSNEAASKNTATNSLNGDFATFLKLLTTQLQNQDPLDPTNSTEFVAQLANFSSVEQQVQTNTKLNSMLTALSSTSATRAADFIGKQVQAPAKASFTGEPIAIGMDAVSGASTAKMIVKNDFGSTAATLTIPGGQTSYTWDGTDGTGKTLPNGKYSFSIESYNSDKTLLDTQQGTVFSTVREVRVENGTPTLVLDSGDKVSLDSVTALR